ncbi:MAG: hypothetical protein ACRDV4_09085, partial [Acidimicrobiales bacterium]
LGIAGGGIALIGFAPAAGADGSGSSSIVGYTVSVQALGIQYAFNIPGIVPLPGDNLLEEDVPFARTNITQGPVVNALGAPYYPGDILANLGGLIAEFTPPSTPAFPDDPLLAMADYPPTPSHGTDASFGGNPPPGSPISPNVFSATAHAGSDGGTVTSTLSDLQASPPSSTSSQAVHLGPRAAAGALGSVTGSAPLLEAGAVQATNQVTLSGSSVVGTAATVLKQIDVAGVLDISEVTSNASSTSDGNQGSPSAGLHVSGATVDGQPAYIDSQGVHVSGKTVAPDGVTPQQAQNALDTTFAQDGISVRVVDPETNTNGAEGTADSGGLVVSFTHPFDVPYVPGTPTIPVPELGNTGLPAGVYTATTSITLGSAVSDVQATSAPANSSASTGLGGAGGLGLGTGAIASSFGSSTGGLPGFTSTPGTPAGGGSTSAAANGSEALGSRASSRLPLGIPAPVGWLIVGLILCVLFAYPMLLTVRWQFLSGRGR